MWYNINVKFNSRRTLNEGFKMKLNVLNDFYLDGDFKIEIKDESNYCLESKDNLCF